MDFMLVDPTEVARREAKKHKIALALLEQCKSEREIRVSDLEDIFKIAKRLIVL